MVNIITSIFVHCSFFLCIAMIVMILRKCQPSQVRLSFISLLGIMALWNAATFIVIDILFVTGVTSMFFLNISYIGVCLVPVSVLYFGKVILNPEWEPQLIDAVFLIVPLVSIFMIFTNPLHHLFFINFSLNSYEIVTGVYFYIHSLYSYGCIAAGIVLMFIASARHSGLFSRQSLLVISGIIITVVPNILFSFGAADLPFSISSAAFTVSIICFAVAFFKYRLITALPISLRQVVDLISDGYLVVDKEFCILSYNRALINMFSGPVTITLGEHIRTFIEQYFLDNYYDRFLELEAKALMQRRTVSAEGIILGNTHVSVEVTPVMQGSIQTGSIILLKDVTQSKVLIAATEAASRAKSEFLANMSHEIRTPMNAIIGMVTIGKSTKDIERKNYSLAKIDDASKHLLGIINDILDMSKIEAGKFELSCAEFNFEKMIQRVVDIINYRIEGKRQKFNVTIDPDVPKNLIGDDHRLTQVIINLLGNAVKFTPEEGSITFEVRNLGEKNEKGSGASCCTIQLKVTDTGIGISPEHQVRLFQSFTQADSDTARNFRGAGLGLSISKNIVEMMGGKIWVESEVGKGSSFIFTIEVTIADTKTGSGGLDEEETKGMQQDIRGIFRGHRILLAEDIEINREIVIALLEPTLLEIDCVENGAEAVRIFSEGQAEYDLIFMDVQMPEMDGYEATRRIRKIEAERESLERPKSVPIIAMTASVFREDLQKCIDAGMDDHIGKPFEFNKVLDILRTYLVKKPTVEKFE